MKSPNRTRQCGRSVTWQWNPAVRWPGSRPHNSMSCMPPSIPSSTACFLRVSAECKQAYLDEAEQHIQSQLDAADLPRPAKLQFVVEPPDSAIMHCIEQHSADIVAMGALCRTGITGFITGNTAKRLVPRIPCSLLVVEPPGFESPVSPGQRRVLRNRAPLEECAGKRIERWIKSRDRLRLPRVRFTVAGAVIGCQVGRDVLKRDSG